VVAFLLIGLALVTIAVLGVILSTRKMRNSPREGLSPESRIRFSAIDKLSHRIASLMAQIPSGSSTSALFPEILAESNSVREEVLRLLQVRDRAMANLARRSADQVDLAELELRSVSAGSVEERQSLEAALAAKRAESASYSDLKLAVERIDGQVRESEAVLTELVARLSLAATQSEVGQSDGLRESLSRARSLSQTIEEVRQTLGS
jgi:hypothetical protein